MLVLSRSFALKTWIFYLVWWFALVENSEGNRTCGLQPVFRSAGDLRLTIIVNECSSSALSKTIVITSAWICERLNFLEVFGGIRVGVDIYNVCGDLDMIDPLVNSIKSNGSALGVVTWNPVSRKLRTIASALNIPLTEVSKHWTPLITATVGLLSALHWNENVTVVTDNPDVLTLFYHESRKEWICVKSVKSFREQDFHNYNSPTVIFGSEDELNTLLKNATAFEFNKLIIVPLDGSQLEGLPEGAYILQPIYADIHQKLAKSPKIIASPILLDVAIPVINIAKNVSRILESECNKTQEVKCLRKKIPDISSFDNPYVSHREALQFLKIEPLIDKFLYNIFKVEYFDLSLQKSSTNGSVKNESDLEVSVLQSLVKVGSYSLLNYTLILDGFVEEDNSTENGSSKALCSQDHRLCIFECFNYKMIYPGSPEDEYLLYNIVLKQDPWVLAVLSIASLGVMFCLAILIFIFVRLCKKDIFEGNPVLSVLLLLVLTIMYASVVPFALEVTFESEFRSLLSDYLCLARYLVVTLSYSCAFSLMLSRCIMLATVAYEAGFMSHITGHVQSLLCLFMIAVQGALSLQSIDNCQELFATNSFVYALCYNILLLGLLLFSCPFIYRSQRNYKEGGYFSIAIMLVTLVWIAWLTAYVTVDERWKLTVICSGLLGTASAILGAVFIPRTYLMTGAVVRDSLTSALPSLAFASSTSVLDLNYSSAQHVYDCVNIATINAANQTAPPAVSQCNPNFYSEEPGLETTEISAISTPCDSPDKVTRF